MSFSIVQPVYAACNPNAQGLKLTDCLLLNNDQSVASVYSTPAALINILVSSIFVIAGVILFFMFIYAGFLFIMDPTTKAKDKAKDLLTTAVTGLVVMFAAFWILQIVKVFTGADLLF
jgi:hypothetical protein